LWNVVSRLESSFGTPVQATESRTQDDDTLFQIDILCVSDPAKERAAAMQIRQTTITLHWPAPNGRR
jgi:hypothetical protein